MMPMTLCYSSTTAGIDIWSSGFAPLVMTSRAEALIEELRRERMREEILARQIADNRMMEEEIMRELEFERQMAMRRFGEEEMESRVGIGMGERLGPGFISERERSLSRGRAWIYDGLGPGFISERERSLSRGRAWIYDGEGVCFEF
ncbi:uncharacterized protein A4U43_C05F5460 [Asparagus officinalis]|uniref:Uncharacterized protein n=1 Tax=Asparagus officinalis TaxID=4686 RepID=A0A5P1EPJ4_ASPOF|nr:uncharacterized protein A4U43_C05F5460 [Asparagus officinalis]